MRRLARSARSFIPTHLSLPQLRESAAGCTGCDLYKHATQTVFGEGASHASIMIVGEQPGDQEDVAGHPFVGPAGKILDKALAEAGIVRNEVYVTNAVKHFKWEPQLFEGTVPRNEERTAAAGVTHTLNRKYTMSASWIT